MQTRYGGKTLWYLVESHWIPAFRGISVPTEGLSFVRPACKFPPTPSRAVLRHAKIFKCPFALRSPPCTYPESAKGKKNHLEHQELWLGTPGELKCCD